MPGAAHIQSKHSQNAGANLFSDLEPFSLDLTIPTLSIHSSRKSVPSTKLMFSPDQAFNYCLLSEKINEW